MKKRVDWDGIVSFGLALVIIGAFKVWLEFEKTGKFWNVSSYIMLGGLVVEIVAIYCKGRAKAAKPEKK